MLFRLPTVLLIGVQKASTSSLAAWIFDKGGVCRPKVFKLEPKYYNKEVHFFDVESRFAQGPEFYIKRFQHCGENATTMDASPDTLPYAERVRNTYEAAGGDQAATIKIIVVLREPVSRELSLYNHMAFQFRTKTPNEWNRQVSKEDGFEFVLNRSIPALLARDTGGLATSTRYGMYATYLRKWFQLFDRSQILVLSYDELKNNPARLQESVQMFLGLPILGSLPRSNTQDSAHKVKLPSRKAKESLLDVFAPLNEELYKLLESNPGPSMEQRPFPRFQEPAFDTNSTNR